MSVHVQETVKRISVPDIAGRKGGEPIVCLTAYDAPMAGLLDPHCDVLLVGDSVGMAVHGLPNTVGVTLDMMILHGQAVVRGSRRALVVVDMPFGSYEGGKEAAYDNCVRVMKETGAQAVKLEGGRRRLPMIEALVAAEVPVMGHIGLTPQSMHAMGGFKVQGRDAQAALGLVDDAKELAHAGCFAIVLEGVPDRVAARVTRTVDVPTIGIGAGPDCDGQVLVFHDVLGLEHRVVPKFVRRYADLHTEGVVALRHFADDVRSGAFPTVDESYRMADAEAEALGLYGAA